MLRLVGFLLVVSSALSVLDALHSIFRYVLEGWLYWIEIAGFIYSLIFALIGLASGLRLLRDLQSTRETLHQIGRLGIWVGAPLAVLSIAQLGLSLSSFELDVFYEFGWWPPKEPSFGFLWLALGTPPLSENALLFWTMETLSTIFQSPFLWVFAPLAVCCWAVWGGAVGWADKVFAYVAIVLSIVLTISAGITGWGHYLMATYVYDPDIIIEYIYVPEIGWYAFYATKALLLLGVALLLFRREPKMTTA